MVPASERLLRSGGGPRKYPKCRRWRSHTYCRKVRKSSARALDRHGFHRDNKVDSVYVFSLQVGVIRDKEVNSGTCSTSQLHGVRGAERPIQTQRCINLGRLKIERDHHGRRSDGFLVLQTNVGRTTLEWLHEHFTNRQC